MNVLKYPHIFTYIILFLRIIHLIFLYVFYIYHAILHSSLPSTPPGHSSWISIPFLCMVSWTGYRISGTLYLISTNMSYKRWLLRHYHVQLAGQFTFLFLKLLLIQVMVHIYEVPCDDLIQNSLSSHPIRVISLFIPSYVYHFFVVRAFKNLSFSYLECTVH